MRFRATYILMLATILPYAMGLSWPLQAGGESYPFLLYGFSHTNALHLLFNLLALLTFGLGIERKVGGGPLISLYLLSIIAGGICHVLLGSAGAVVGASGGIYGLLTVYGFLNPNKRVLLLVFPMRALTLTFIAIAIEVAMVLLGWLPGIAHWAHIGGAAFGFGFAIGSDRKWIEN